MAADLLVPERAISKTQLELWRSCERKFGWSYLEGLRSQNRFAEFGVKIHAQLERWLRHGILPDMAPEGRVAESGLHHLPAPNTPGLMVESEIFTITQQAIYHGFADWIEPASYSTGHLPVIGDHKSTVDFRWAHTEESLELDIQANIYARAVMQLYGVDAAVARWVYYRTRGAPKSHSVERKMTREGVERVFAEIIDPLAAQIQEAWEHRPNVLDLAPNTRACSDYGGCPFRSNCNIEAKGRFLAMVAHEGLAARMKAQAEARKKQAATPVVSEPDAKEVPVNPPEAATGGTLAERMAARMKAQAEARKKQAATPVVSEPDAKEVPVNPPEAAKAGTLAERMAALRKPAAQPAAAPEAKKAAPAAQPATGGTLAERMKALKERPRPTQAPVQTTIEEVVQVHSASAPSAAQAPTQQPTATPQPALGEAGYVLLVNCMPLRTNFVEASDIIQRAKATVGEELGLVDYRLADFGQGPALLAHAIRQILADDPPPAGSLVYLDKRTDEGRHSYEVFRERAALVIHSL